MKKKNIINDGWNAVYRKWTISNRMNGIDAILYGDILAWNTRQDNVQPNYPKEYTLTNPQIVTRLGFNRDKIKKSLTRLEEQKLIARVNKNQNRVIIALDFDTGKSIL